jgi:hypothetical protein
MATQGRRGGTSRKRTSDTNAAQPAPVPAPAVPESAPTIEPAAAATAEPEVELLDDRSILIAGSRRGPGLGRALPGAVLGSLLVVGLAFGAALGPGGALGPKVDPSRGDTTAALGDGHGGTTSDQDGGYDGGDSPKDDWDGGEPGATDKPDQVDPTDKPAPEATEKTVPEATKEPATEPDPTKKPAPEPDPTKEPTEPMSLGLALKYDHPLIEWSSCAGLDFSYYKVVRSKDSTVSWPTGDGDELIAAVERGGERLAYDKGAPHGQKSWYRVFCVRKTDAGYKVVNASVTKGIWVPEETLPPDPIQLALEAGLNEEGKVVLSWSACEVDGFAFYKVVKSTWNENPSYLPWTDGSEVIGVVGAMHETEWHDWAPDAGETAYYRVQCIGYDGDHKVLLGQSAVVAVSMP